MSISPQRAGQRQALTVTKQASDVHDDGDEDGADDGDGDGDGDVDVDGAVMMLRTVTTVCSRTTGQHGSIVARAESTKQQSGVRRP